jgi:hypothetical protein
MRKIYGVLTILFWLNVAHAETFIQQYIPGAKAVSKARYSVLIFDVYDATFYTVSGKPEVKPPFALQLAYLRDFKGEDIADRSAEEMRSQQGVDELTLADWHSQMRNIFPNVEEGDSITGIYQAKAECSFYKNKVFIGQVVDDRFCHAFFDIWFGENTSAPKLREKLLTQTTFSIKKSK